ncbi:MAG: hypothetical protein ACYDAI_18270 [Trichloromonadaceae bacterium]
MMTLGGWGMEKARQPGSEVVGWVRVERFAGAPSIAYNKRFSIK